MEDKLYNILEKFILNNNIKINPEDFKLQLISNPSFPSVKAISDTLDYFGIDNIVANVPKDTLEQLPEYFLAVISKDSNKSITQVQQLNNKIKLFHENGTKEKISISDFKDIWNGTIIAVEKSNETKNFAGFSLKKTIYPIAIVALIASIYTILKLEVPAVFYFIFALVGCALSYLIVRENLGLKNKSTSKICNSAENNTSCNEVINSENSKLFGVISLSDASITFFVSLVSIIVIFGFDPNYFAAISILSIPIIAYSVFSQAYIIKKWCPLCLGIIGVMVAQIIITIPFLTAFNIDIPFLLKGVTLTLSYYLLWINIKAILQKSIKQEQTEIDFYKFKRNENLFNTLLVKDKLINQDSLNTITFGNPNAPIEITSITNPLCGFCTKAFESYDYLLNTLGDKIKLHIVFNVSSEDTKNPATQISQRIIEIYQINKEDAYKALKKWFEIRAIDKWQEAYSKPTMLSNYESLNSHYNWCLENDINYTPATLIGNYFFPKEYEIKDLSLFLDFLIEVQIKNKQKEPSIH